MYLLSSNSEVYFMLIETRFVLNFLKLWSTLYAYSDRICTYFPLTLKYTLCLMRQDLYLLSSNFKVYFMFSLYRHNFYLISFNSKVYLMLCTDRIFTYFPQTLKYTLCFVQTGFFLTFLKLSSRFQSKVGGVYGGVGVHQVCAQARCLSQVN